MWRMGDDKYPAGLVSRRYFKSSDNPNLTARMDDSVQSRRIHLALGLERRMLHYSCVRSAYDSPVVQILNKPPIPQCKLR